MQAIKKKGARPRFQRRMKKPPLSLRPVDDLIDSRGARDARDPAPNRGSCSISRAASRVAQEPEWGLELLGGT